MHFAFDMTIFSRVKVGPKEDTFSHERDMNSGNATHEIRIFRFPR